MYVPQAPRVCWITEEFPPETGGTGLVAARITAEMARQDVEVEVLTRQTRPARAAEESYGAVHVRRIRPGGALKGAGWRALPAILLYLVRLTALLLRRARHDDVIIVSCMKIIPLVAVPLARMLGKSCIVRLESPFELIEPIAAESLARMNRFGRAACALLGAAQRRVLSHADRVVAISAEVESRLRQTPCPPERILRIPNPIDLERFRPVERDRRAQLRDALGLPRERVLVLYAGRLSRAKGVLMLVASWRELLGRHPQALLVMAGSGHGSWDDCEAELKELIRAQALERDVLLVGATDRVHEYMQACDVYVCPSEYEGFSLAIGEALASGLPSVVTAVGAAPEIIEDGVSGFLFPPKDPNAMLAALNACLGSPERWADIGRRARESVAPFALDRVAARYVVLCRELARSRGVPVSVA